MLSQFSFAKVIQSLFGLKDANNQTSSSELEHINQEMYKKSAELVERNKTLSLLQKIDEIIISDITHLSEIAQQVTSLLVTDIDFQLVALFLYDKNEAQLKRIAFSQAVQQAQELPYLLQIALKDTDNRIVQAVTEKERKFSQTITGVLLSQTTSEAHEIVSTSVVIKSVFINPLIVRGEVIGAMVICIRESEEELSQYRKDLLNRLVELIGIALDNSILYNEVQESNEKLKELDKLKDEFVSVASHELRTPMTAIKSYLWMALSGKGGELTEKQKYYLERAYSSVDRLIKMVNDMLNISRIESGKIIVKIQNIDLQKLTQEVIDEVIPRAQELGVSIELVRENSLPSVQADPDKIKEVLFNLVGNSLKFTPKEGKISVTFFHSGDMVETKIHDTGAGIEAEDLPKLFQKFGLLPGSYTTNQTVSGTGLGLYICRAIVDLHKGKIWAHSQGRGRGSEFGFSLKAYNADNLSSLLKDNEGKEELSLIHTHV